MTIFDTIANKIYDSKHFTILEKVEIFERLELECRCRNKFHWSGFKEAKHKNVFINVDCLNNYNDSLNNFLYWLEIDKKLNS